MIIENIGTFSAPTLIIIILIFAIKSKINIFDSFIKGAKEGLECMISILPAIIALITAVTMFKSSGAMNLIIKFLNPIFSFLKFPKECIPLLIMKPISGSGSNAILNSIFETNGPDSYVGKLSSIISGSSEAIFYIVSTYCGAIKFTKTKNIIFFALISFVVSVLFALIIC